MKIKKSTYKIYFSKKRKTKSKFQKVSIITVVYNAGDTLEKTIKNVINQDYENIEYIMVYTPSEDNTLDIIKKYKDKFDKIIFNFKIGIYQSMNLGIKFSTGKYINFMNSGDTFYNKKIVSKIFETKQFSDVIYGDCKIYYEDFSRYIKAENKENIKTKMFFSHQSCFTKTYIQKKLGFDTKFNLSADYDFFLKLYLMKKNFYYTKNIISCCKAFGIVDIKQVQTLTQNYKIAKKNLKDKSFNFVIKNFYFICLKIITSIIKKILPRNLLLKILKIKYL